MPGRIITVTPERLETAAGTIEGLAGDYQSQYTAMYGKTTDLASTWQGDDNIAFVKQIEGFHNDLKSMYDLMIKYAEFLRTSAKTYRTTQENVVENARRLVN